MWTRICYGKQDMPFNYSEFICDTEDDLDSLPTNKKYEGNNPTLVSCAIGSEAIVVNSRTKYILNNDNKWELLIDYGSTQIGDIETDKKEDTAYISSVEVVSGALEDIECTKTVMTIGNETTTIIKSNVDSSNTDVLKAGDIISITKEIDGIVVYEYYFLDSTNEIKTSNNIYNSIEQLISKKGIIIDIVAGEDNTQKIIDVLDDGEEFIDWFDNSTSNNRYGIHTDLGSVITQLQIYKLSDTDATILAITDYGKVFTRLFKSGVLGDWISDHSYNVISNTSTLKIDITGRESLSNNAFRINYLFGGSLTEIELTIRNSVVNWSTISGKNYIKNVTYTKDTDNTAHYTIGIEFYGKVYGVQQIDVVGSSIVVNSFTKDAFTGAITALRIYPYGKLNGVTLVDNVECLGLTSPCTTVKIAQELRKIANISPIAACKGIFNNDNYTITDAPTDFGLLEINCYGYDRIMIRYEGIDNATYNGSYIGRINGSNGTFSNIEWESDNVFNGAVVKSVTIDLSASDFQSTSGSMEMKSLSKYINNSANIIRVEGYYIPPEDSGNLKTIIMLDPYMIGGIGYENDKWVFTVAGSTTATGSGFAKLYYVE